MPLSDLELKELVRKDVNGVSDISMILDTQFASLVDDYWELYGSFAGRGNLRYLHTRKHGFFFLMSKAKKSVDTTIGTDSYKYRGLFLNLQTLYEETVKAIRDEEDILAGINGGIATLQVLEPCKTAPTTYRQCRGNRGSRRYGQGRFRKGNLDGC